MFHYLIILLDDTSTSFCHADNPLVERNLIPLSTLQKVFLFALKENLSVQLVYPNYELPSEYKKLIFDIEHTNIVPLGMSCDADVVVINSIEDYNDSSSSNLIIRETYRNIISSYEKLAKLLLANSHISLVIKDIETIRESDLSEYETLINNVETIIADSIIKGKSIRMSNITDRLTLSKMNNCNAGWRSITLAPNGHFYICPSFYYYDPKDSVGNIEDGITIKNHHLYKLSYAPICSLCDCYQCKRCIWLNKRLTNEVNTPSHQQCVLSHYERNGSKKLLDDIRLKGEYLNGVEIPTIEYLDPIDILIK